MNKTKWIIFVVVILALFGVLTYRNKSNDTAYTGDASQIITEGPITDHVYGTEDQKVILIEYADYQCPGCASMTLQVKDMLESYKDKVTFIYRNLPLSNMHPNALAAATAVEAAGLQGKYYEMHDIMFANQDSWSNLSSSERTVAFELYAVQAGVDIEQYRSDIGSADIQSKIKRDQQTAATFAIDQTPTFILDGEKLSTDVGLDVAKLEAALQAKIASAYAE